MNDEPERIRRQAVARAEAWLRARTTPRFHMLVIVCATGAAAWFFSFALLHLGLDSMAVRYPLAVALSYLVFLLLLRVWFSTQQMGEPSLTPGDLVQGVADVGNSGLPFPEGGSGGGGVAGDALGALGLDECIFLVVALVAVLAGLMACLYVIWTAPGLLAEVFVDGVVMAGVYRRLRRADASLWMVGAVRRTFVPAMIVMVSFALAGLAMQLFAPKAKSIGGVVAHFTESRP